MAQFTRTLADLDSFALYVLSSDYYTAQPLRNRGASLLLVFRGEDTEAPNACAAQPHSVSEQQHEV